MKNNKTFLLAVLVACGLSAGAQATTISQTTSPSAATSPGTYSGSMAAAQVRDSDKAQSGPASAEVKVALAARDATGMLSMGTTEASRAAAPHNVAARAELANKTAAAERVSEPAAEILMMMALGALAIAVRRQAKD